MRVIGVDKSRCIVEGCEKPRKKKSYSTIYEACKGKTWGWL